MPTGKPTAVRHPLQQRVVNPVIKLVWRLGFPSPGDALLETTGRRTGRPRYTPVCDGLDGRAFWLVAQAGRRSDWVRKHRSLSSRTGEGGQLAANPLAGRKHAHSR